jgi:hypothetical protein
MGVSVEQVLKDRLLAFVSNVYQYEPLDDDMQETELALEAMELMDMLVDAGAKESLWCDVCEMLEDNCKECKNA